MGESQSNGDCFGEILGLRDSSGLRLYYTDQLRQYEMATIITGVNISPFQFIPPGLKNFESVGLCTPECTREVRS